MTRPLIYIIAIFALWLYFKYSGGTASTTEPKAGGGGSSGGSGATRSFESKAEAWGEKRGVSV